jgi:hypothetical protein
MKIDIPYTTLLLANILCVPFLYFYYLFVFFFRVQQFPFIKNRFKSAVTRFKRTQTYSDTSTFHVNLLINGVHLNNI